MFLKFKTIIFTRISNKRFFELCFTITPKSMFFMNPVDLVLFQTLLLKRWFALLLKRHRLFFAIVLAHLLTHILCKTRWRSKMVLAVLWNTLHSVLCSVGPLSTSALLADACRQCNSWSTYREFIWSLYHRLQIYMNSFFRQVNVGNAKRMPNHHSSSVEH